MNIVGIVAEYNPFHLGHAHHIKKTAELLGGDIGVVGVMSGNFVQRGDVAVFSKHSRALAAVQSGVDLVLELPLPFALSSAEGFARGAVGLLGSLGVVTHLSFGSECGDLAPLNEAAEALLAPDFDVAIRLELESGISYAAARQKVLESRIGERAKIVQTPNNILAVEYLKTILDQRFDIEPVTVLRSGAGHDQRDSTDGFRSAAELRGRLYSGVPISGLTTRAAESIYSTELLQGRGPVTLDALETAILSRLRIMTDEAFAKVPDASEGIYNRLAKAARSESTIQGILSAAKTKRYAMSRLRRMLMCTALGIGADMSVGTPPYARVLAANDTGREILKNASGLSRIPIITKPATTKDFGGDVRLLFAMESAADDLFVLGYPAKQERKPGSAFRITPAFVSGRHRRAIDN